MASVIAERRIAAAQHSSAHPSFHTLQLLRFKNSPNQLLPAYLTAHIHFSSVVSNILLAYTSCAGFWQKFSPHTRRCQNPFPPPNLEFLPSSQSGPSCLSSYSPLLDESGAHSRRQTLFSSALILPCSRTKFRLKWQCRGPARKSTGPDIIKKYDKIIDNIKKIQ